MNQVSSTNTINPMYALVFQIALTLLVASVFLIEHLKNILPSNVYNFIKTHRDTILGAYYILLAYRLYNTFVLSKPA